MKLYKADLESDLYKDLKIFYNLRKIKDSGLLEELNTFYLKPTIVLFVSCVSGTDTETSDLDLLIISEKTKIPDVKKFEKKIKRKIQLFVVRNLRELKNKHLLNNILNGITIQGKIRWVK